MDTQTSMDDGTGRIETSAGGELNLCEADGNQEPYEGMLFESEEAARAFYDEYAGRVGFVTRVLSSRKSERDGSTISRGLGCRDGSDTQKTESLANQKRDRRREGCTAMILVKREKPGRWVVRKFVKDHNHPLVVSLAKRRSTFDERDKKIQELTAELRVKKRLSAAYREQLRTLMKDVEDHNEHLSTKVQVVLNNLKELEAKRGAFAP
uniref:FAR1 domain-containing protein n=1 Tax=Davidia involucrata TaxID=16924 RepID=A0A5B7A2I9_DAVIN